MKNGACGRRFCYRGSSGDMTGLSAHLHSDNRCWLKASAGHRSGRYLSLSAVSLDLHQAWTSVVILWSGV